ncbi:MAG: AEC family transporter [Candidatus Omnitrophica bacterium]|nr:AEC family transporter [Candidatus Omnitrophota bacterium]
MLLESFRATGLAVAQIFILGVIGYILVKKDILGLCGLDTLSRLAIEVTLPAMIFCQLIRDFSFQLYPDWWIYPLMSIAVTIAGLAVGAIFVFFINGHQKKAQFLSLVAFQNSGYLPLALVAALIPPEQAGTIFIYLFLFLLGFNLVMFSLGVYILFLDKGSKFEWHSLFSPPVVATLASLFLVWVGLNKFVPDFVFKPIKLVGDCTLPLAIFVVGGNLAQIRLKNIDKKAMSLLVLVKLVILPLAGLLFLVKFRMPELIGLLLLIELAVPSATTLSALVRHYKKEDLLISQGVFLTHLAGIITLPLFLSLYFMFIVIK